MIERDTIERPGPAPQVADHLSWYIILSKLSLTFGSTLAMISAV